MTTTHEKPRTASGLFRENEIRVEGREKVSGKMNYTADIQRTNTLWAAFATSPFAHAKVLRVHTEAAKAVPGVVAVLTAEDIGPRRFGRNLFDWPVLAYDTVRLIGDRVAAVAAETREAAEEAARLIEVDYEELPIILNPAAALADGAPILHPERASYFFKAYEKKERPRVPHPNIQGTNVFRKGEADLGPLFASAYKVFEHRYTTPRLHCGYIEPRSTLVWIDDDGTVHVQSPNKSPVNLRDAIAVCVGIPKETIVIEPSAIGGDFGGKGFTIDEFPCYYLAKATGRPVRHVQTYAEELGISATRHRAYITLKSAIDRHGRFIAHYSDVVYDGGAYAGSKGSPLLMAGTGYATVPYQVPNVFVEIKSVYTNTLPAAHVRAPIDVQIFFAWEQHVEVIAHELGIDGLEFRKLNVIREGQTAITDEPMHHPMGIEVLETLAREAGRSDARVPGRGRGMSLVCRHTGGGKTSIKIRLTAAGKVAILTGVPDQGAGAFTVIVRVAAATLGVKPERIAIRRGNTAEAPVDPGAGASRVTHVHGNAAKIAAAKLKTLLETASGMTIRDDRFVDAATGRTESFETVAARVCAAGEIEAVGAYDGTHGDPAHPPDFTFSAFSIEVDVDRETGAFAIRDALIVTDVGEIISPVGHQGQIDGGFIFGLGGARMEEIEIDESGKVTTLSLGEYKLPTMMDIPPFRTVLVKAPPGGGPYGAKMAGELSNSGVTPALINAIHDAVGIRLNEFPLTSERIYAALHEPVRA